MKQGNNIISTLRNWREYSWTHHESRSFIKVVTYTGIGIEFDNDDKVFRIFVGNSEFNKKNYPELVDVEYRTIEEYSAHYITKLFMMAQDFIVSGWKVCYDHLNTDIYDSVNVLAQLKKGDHIVTLTDLNVYVDDEPYFEHSIFDDFIVGEVVEDIHRKLFW